MADSLNDHRGNSGNGRKGAGRFKQRNLAERQTKGKSSHRIVRLVPFQCFIRGFRSNKEIRLLRYLPRVVAINLTSIVDGCQWKKLVNVGAITLIWLPK